VGQALKGGMREKVQLATKFGLKFVDGTFEVQGDPAYVRACCEASLKRLDVDYIDLYYQHRIDTRIPIEVTVCVLHDPLLTSLVICLIPEMSYCSDSSESMLNVTLCICIVPSSHVLHCYMKVGKNICFLMKRMHGIYSFKF